MEFYINYKKMNTLYLVGHLCHFVLWPQIHLNPTSALEMHATITGRDAQ